MACSGRAGGRLAENRASTHEPSAAGTRIGPSSQVSVNIASVAHSVHGHDGGTIDHLVDDSILRHNNPVKVTALQFDRTYGARFCAQSNNRRVDPLDDVWLGRAPGESLEIAFSGAGQLELVRSSHNSEAEFAPDLLVGDPFIGLGQGGMCRLNIER